MIKRVSRILIRWRYLFLTAAALLAAVAFVYLDYKGGLSFDRSIENMFADDDPLLPPYQKLKRTFGGSEVVLAAYVDPELQSPAGFARIKALTDKIEEDVEGVESVVSLSTTPLGDHIFDDTSGAEKLRELFAGFCLGEDGQTTAVLCVLDPKAESKQREDAVKKIQEMLEQHDPPGVVAGEPVMVAEGFSLINKDGKTLGRTSLLLLSITILVCFRSLRWLLIPLAVIQLTLLTTRATLVWLQLQLSMVSSMLTAIVTVIAVATVVHVIVRFRDARARGDSRLKAMLQTTRLLALPVVWACATDAVGFAALLTAHVGPVQDFGVMMAVGSLLVIVGVALLVPGLALLGRIDADPRQAFGESRLAAGLKRLVDGLFKRPKTIGLVTFLVAVVVIAGCFRLTVETDFTKNFRANSQIAKSYDLVESRLGGAGVIDVILPAPTTLDEAYIERLRKFQQRLSSEVVVTDDSGLEQHGLTKILSLADALEIMDSPQLIDQIELPASMALLAKFLPFAEFLKRMPIEMRITALKHVMPSMVASLRGKETFDGKEQPYVRIMLRARERQSAEQKNRVIERVRAITLEEFPPADYPGTEVTGFYVLLNSLVESMVADQWRTFGVAAAGIAVMMLLVFRSFRLALVAVVPNAIPILIVTGLMGWLGFKINMGAAMIAAVSLGLSIDSSIHYLSVYRRARAGGDNVEQAIHVAHQTVGRAMVFSTLALIVGFTALCGSQFVPTVYFGALVSLSMLGGLLGNLIVLPLLLLAVEK